MSHVRLNNFSARWILLSTGLIFFHTAFCQQDLLLNGDFEELLKYKSWNIVSQNGPAQIITHEDTFRFSGAASRDFAHVIAQHWDYTDTSKVEYSNASYSNTGRTFNGNVFKIIPVLDLVSNPEEPSVAAAVGTLCTPLLKDHTYRVKLHLKPFSGNHFTASICAALIPQPLPYAIGINKETKKPLFDLNVEPAWCLPGLLEDTTQYTAYEFQYTASGGEQYIYIGNLQYQQPDYWDKKNWKNHFKSTKQYGYWRNYDNRFMCRYALDAVSVEPLDKNESCTVAEKTVEDTTLALRFFFSYDESETDSSIAIVINEIQKCADLKTILIVGHTSHEGTEEYNQQLSYNRAKFIADKLSGSTNVPMEIAGRGYAEPFSLTEEELNRRTEVYLIRATEK